mgnify:CR=1 FL=1
MENASAIICAFNEERTISGVITSVAQSNLFQEIIVVNDGSTDKTKNTILECKDSLDIIDIHLPINLGKGFAMATGIDRASSKILVFCDADLSDLKSEHLRQLLLPIFLNKADMVLGQPTKDTTVDFVYNPLKSLTGERALLKQDILPLIEKFKNSRFGVETLINLYYKAQNKRVIMIQLFGLKHYIKFEKANQFQAIKQYLSEGHQIARAAVKNYPLLSKNIFNAFYKTLSYKSR